MVENTGIFGDLQGFYEDNLVFKIYCKVILIGIVPVLFKIALKAYTVEFNPNIVDTFALARENDVKDLDAVLRRACAAI